MERLGTVRNVTVALLMAATPAGISSMAGTEAVSFIGGVVVDSITAHPIPGVMVYVNGTLKDSSNAEGRYRVKGLKRGDYVMRLELPEAAAVMDGITLDATIDAVGVQYYLDVLWPSMERVVAERCEEDYGSRSGPVALLGRVREAGADSAREYGRWVATVTWSGETAGKGPTGAPGHRQRVVVPVLENGGFLVCHLSAGVSVRLVVEDPFMGPDRGPLLVHLPTTGFVTVRWPNS